MTSACLHFGMLGWAGRAQDGCWRLEPCGAASSAGKGKGMGFLTQHLHVLHLGIALKDLLPEEAIKEKLKLTN